MFVDERNKCARSHTKELGCCTLIQLKGLKVDRMFIESLVL